MVLSWKLLVVHRETPFRSDLHLAQLVAGFAALGISYSVMRCFEFCWRCRDRSRGQGKWQFGMEHCFAEHQKDG